MGRGGIVGVGEAIEWELTFLSWAFLNVIFHIIV